MDNKFLEEVILNIVSSSMIINKYAAIKLYNLKNKLRLMDSMTLGKIDKDILSDSIIYSPSNNISDMGLSTTDNIYINYVYIPVDKPDGVRERNTVMYCNQTTIIISRFNDTFKDANDDKNTLEVIFKDIEYIINTIYGNTNSVSTFNNTTYKDIYLYIMKYFIFSKFADNIGWLKSSFVKDTMIKSMKDNTSYNKNDDIIIEYLVEGNPTIEDFVLYNTFIPILS